MLVREAIRLQTDGHSLGEVVAYLEEQNETSLVGNGR